MEIVSISMDEETLSELDRTKERLGFKSRSRLLRATIDSLLNEYKAIESMKGHCDAVFTITHMQHGESGLGNLLREFDDVIVTEIHQHHRSICLRILITCADANRTRELFSHLKREKDVRSVKISVL